MGIREDVLALADELEAFEDGDCEECIAYGQPECKGHLSCAEIIARYSARKVREAVERDAEDVTTVSAYDLLSDEDRKAIAWVRDHGGLDEVEKRIMPEGMEGPTVDGEPVVIGERMRSCGIEDCKVVGIDPANARLFLAFNDIEKGKAVYFPDLAKDCHRPAPKVLDADGVEIREGDVLYSVETGDYVIVNSIEPGNPWFATTDGALQHCAKFTHRAPVIAADGKPLEVGQTVYATHYGYVKCTVLAIEWVVDGYLVEVENEGGHKFRQTPDEFIHQRPEPPDSWERIKEDAKLWPGEYAQGHPGWAEHDGRLSEFMALDLVRRCRALAERGE